MPSDLKTDLLEKLKNLLSSQFQEVVFQYGMPDAHLRKNVSQAEQAIDLIRYADQQADGLSRLESILANLLILSDRAWNSDELMQEARAAVEAGDYERAQQLLSQANDAYLAQIKHLETHDPGCLELDDFKLKRANTQALIGRLYESRLQYETAGRYFQQAIKLAPQGNQPGEYELRVSDYFTQAGWMAFKLGRYTEAVQDLQAALVVKKKRLAADDPELTKTYNHLAETYREMGYYKDARALYEELLEALELVLDWEPAADTERHLKLLQAEVWNNLGHLYAEYLGQYAEAESAYQDALAIRTEILGASADAVAETLNNLGGVHYRQQHYAEAKQFYEQALAIKDKSEHDPARAFILHALGNVHLRWQEYEKAKELYLQAMKLKTQVLGKQHKSLAATYNQLAKLYQQTHDYKKAIRSYGLALEIQETNLIENHPDIANTLNALASTHYEQQAYAEAVKYFARAEQILRDAESPYLSLVSENLAEARKAQDKSRLVTTQRL